MNEYDSNRIYDIVKSLNYKKTEILKEADCYILNTCHIREKATDKVYHDVGRVKKEFRNKKKPLVLIAGCVAQAEGEVLLNKEKYIDAVVGPQSYQKLDQIISNLEKKTEEINHTEFDVIDKFDSLNKISNSNNKVSSYLTIQEGCDKFCKFCVVPYTRGPEYSRSVKELIYEAQKLISNGAKEIVLLGQNVNAYNYKEYKLSNLIYELSKIKNLKRIRYTTSHPIDFSEDLIIAHKNFDKLMPMIHLPVQSGSDKILKNMNRKHSIKNYLEVINKLKKVNPKIKFSSDFIIGYPGETEKDFEDTLNVLKQVKFINSYSFIFSARPGTPAYNQKKIEENICKERLILFQRTADEIKKNYKEKLLNRICKVLFENKTVNNNEYFGRDEHSNPVIVKSKENLSGLIETVKITNTNKNTLFGVLITQSKRDFAA